MKEMANYPAVYEITVTTVTRVTRMEEKTQICKFTEQIEENGYVADLAPEPRQGNKMGREGNKIGTIEGT